MLKRVDKFTVGMKILFTIGLLTCTGYLIKKRILNSVFFGKNFSAFVFFKKSFFRVLLFIFQVDVKFNGKQDAKIFRFANLYIYSI